MTGRQGGNRFDTLLLVATVLLLVSAGALAYFGVAAAGRTTSAPVPSTLFDIGGEIPDSGVPDYALPALLPNQLAVPSLGIHASVARTGMSGRSMVLPPPTQVSRLLNGVELGSGSGPILIAGHVDDGGGSPGAFWPLHKIRPGDMIYVTDEAGEVHAFRAVRTDLFEKNSLPVELFTDSGPARLVLVTCGGRSVPDVSFPSGFTYEENFVVTAQPVDDTR